MQEILTLIGGLLIIYFVYIIATQKNDNIVADAKSAVYTAIRKLVDHAVDEVHKLPSFENSNSSNSYNEQYDVRQDFSLSRKNQDNLFATVIVNKVVEKYQSEQTENDNVLSSSEASNDDSFNASNAVPANGQNQSYNRIMDILPQNCIHPISVASKFTQTHPSELVSLKYEKRIEEIAAYVSEKYISDDSYDDLDFFNSHRVPFPELGIDIISGCPDLLETCEDEEDDSSYTRTLGLSQSWKENWYFRKRNSNESKPAVSMFVPNSNADYRALIGDKDIDETSDLSDYSPHSDDDIETELVLTIKNAFSDNIDRECNGIQLTDPTAQQQNHTGIAVKSITKKEDKLFRLEENRTDEKFNSDFQFSAKSHSIPLPLQDENIKDSKRYFNIQNEVESMSNMILNQDQQDRDFAEHNTLVPRRHCKGSHDNTNILVSELEVSSIKLEKANGNIGSSGPKITDDESFHLSEKDDLVDNFNLFAPPIPGSIADREHKKWLNAIPIENNPYTTENIHKRLIQKQYTSKSTGSSSYNDMTISNGNGFYFLKEDKESSFEQNHVQNNKEIFDVGEKKEQDFEAHSNEVLHNDDNEIPHNDQSTNSVNQDRPSCNQTDLNVSELKKIVPENTPEDQVEAKLATGRLKNGLTNTQLIKSYFENGEHNENTRDTKVKKENKSKQSCNHRKLKKIASNGQEALDVGKASKTKNGKSKNSTLNKVKVRGTVSRSLDASLTSEVDQADDSVNDKITLPSVKKIVQAFNEKIQEKSFSALTPEKPLNQAESGEPVETQENHIRRTPRQLHLHSLTARSLSREFREGLRQVPKKT